MAIIRDISLRIPDISAFRQLTWTLGKLGLRCLFEDSHLSYSSEVRGFHGLSVRDTIYLVENIYSYERVIDANP